MAAITSALLVGNAVKDFLEAPAKQAEEATKKSRARMEALEAERDAKERNDSVNAVASQTARSARARQRSAQASAQGRAGTILGGSGSVANVAEQTAGAQKTLLGT